MQHYKTPASSPQHPAQHNALNTNTVVVTDEAHEAADRLGHPLPHGELVVLDEETEDNRVFVRVVSKTAVHRINRTKLRPA